VFTDNGSVTVCVHW